MRRIESQPRLSPVLPQVVGNADYARTEQLLIRIDSLLLTSGVEAEFIRDWLAHSERPLSPLERDAASPRARQALRSTVLRSLTGQSFRALARDIAGMPLYQWFCQVDRFPVVRPPSKSALSQYEQAVSVEFIRKLNDLLIQAAAGKTAHKTLELERPLDLDAFFADSTCVKVNIHFPVDWVLLRDAVRTLTKAIDLIRDSGLVRRMPAPALFRRHMNRACIDMTHCHHSVNSKKRRKTILRSLKRLTRGVQRHARTYRDALAVRWAETKLTQAETLRVIERLDTILAQLPAALHQAHERLIGERPVPNEEKIFSLYEPDTQIVIRGKAGGQVEFGNTLLLCEQPQGVIVHFELFRDQAPADARLAPGVAKRLVALFPHLTQAEVKAAFVADRGFHSKTIAQDIGHAFFNAVASKSPAEFKNQCRSKRFRDAQSRRSQTEARVSIVKRCFIGDPILSKGFEHQSIHVAWAVLAHNLWVIARLPKAEVKRHRKAA